MPAHAQDIVVGQIAPFTVLPSPDAHEINRGAQAYFDQINEAGGVGGRRISFFKLDDKFNGDEFALQLEVARTRRPIALTTRFVSSKIMTRGSGRRQFLGLKSVRGADRAAPGRTWRYGSAIAFQGPLCLGARQPVPGAAAAV